MATKANLVIDQGSSFSVTLSLKDDVGDNVDISTYTANSHMRKWYTSTNPAAVFNTAIDTINGELILSLSANQTNSLTPGRYVYDVELKEGAVVSRIVEGIVTVTPQVTR